MPETQSLNIAIIGHRFMGRAHSNGWLQAPRFFELTAQPILKVACGRDEDATQAFAENWGWLETESDWQKVVARDDIDIIDIATPTHLHHDMALAAAANGKHIFCEKPFCLSTAQAENMLEAADKAGIVHYLNHNYRRCPAIRLAKKLIGEGKLGRLYHWRGTYQQDWLADPQTPMRWQLKNEFAGGGPHIDLGSHSVDLARYLMGEISTVSCLKANFVKQRPKPDGNGSGEVDVDDASLMNVEFESGAVGSFECTRYASGRKNHNQFEINGSEGSIIFDLEKMNELQFFSRSGPSTEQGFRTILATDPEHEYVGNWWPPGHIIGYEHAFVHAAADFINAVSGDGTISPDFTDGLRCMQVLGAASRSAESGRREPVSRD
ncbi:MAG: Gfo/Idh/MocA family oxidoreductase [Verrucomicrobiales bacterium]